MTTEDKLAEWMRGVDTFLAERFDHAFALNIANGASEEYLDTWLIEQPALGREYRRNAEPEFRRVLQPFAIAPCPGDADADTSVD